MKELTFSTWKTRSELLLIIRDSAVIEHFVLKNAKVWINSSSDDLWRPFIFSDEQKVFF